MPFELRIECKVICLVGALVVVVTNAVEATHTVIGASMHLSTHAGLWCTAKIALIIRRMHEVRLKF